MKTKAQIVELFSSLQGEGLYTGTPMTFVRFGRCSLGCKWCDTPQSKCYRGNFRIEEAPRSGKFIEKKNPVTIVELNDLLHSFDDKFLSVTGGEPLEQTDFLIEWLPTQINRRILLETNGVFPNELKKVIPFVEIVSMDIKLPSSAGCRPLWKNHAEFLEITNSSRKQIYVKVVVTKTTSDRDLEMAIRLVNAVNKYIPLFIQPASPTLTFSEIISEERLHSIERLCSAYLPNVQVLHQMHKEWQVM